MKVLITGGTGLLGKKLIPFLLQKNIEVVLLSRSTGEFLGCKKYACDYKTSTIDIKAFDGVGAIIHLAGESVAGKRWTKSQKKEIYESRVLYTRFLFETIKVNQIKINSIISASAIGIYGFENSEKLKETSPHGNDFLATVTKDWEQEVEMFTALTIREVRLRIGLVLSADGGALQQMVMPVRFGLGSALGSGDQMMSWIHIDDMVSIIYSSLTNETFRGAYNCVSSQISNLEMTKTIAKVLKKPLFLPAVPTFVLKLILGEMAKIVVSGAYIVPEKLTSQNFNFKFDRLDSALEDLLLK